MCRQVLKLDIKISICLNKPSKISKRIQYNIDKRIVVIHSGTRSPADLSVELMMPLMIYDLKFAKGMQRASQKRTALFIFWIKLTTAFNTPY